MEIRLSELMIIQMSEKVLLIFPLLIDKPKRKRLLRFAISCLVDGHQDKEDICWRTLSSHNSGRRQKLLLTVWKGKNTCLHCWYIYIQSRLKGDSAVV